MSDADTAWQSLFEVRLRYAVTGEILRLQAVPLNSRLYEYQLVNVHTNQVVGTYRTEQYAKKQARRKYNKLIRLLEKNLMS
jgi:hypothetical protein